MEETHKEAIPNICFVCDASASLKCGKCKAIYYCKKECQLKDWKRHCLLCIDSKQEPIDLEEISHVENRVHPSKLPEIHGESHKSDLLKDVFPKFDEVHNQIHSESNTRNCQVCSIECKPKHCGKCGCGDYCSPKCQKLDRESHRPKCAVLTPLIYRNVRKYVETITAIIARDIDVFRDRLIKNITDDHFCCILVKCLDEQTFAAYESNLTRSSLKDYSISSHYEEEAIILFMVEYRDVLIYNIGVRMNRALGYEKKKKESNGINTKIDLE